MPDQFISSGEIKQRYAVLSAVPVIKKIALRGWIALIAVVWIFALYQFIDLTVLQFQSHRDSWQHLAVIPVHPPRAATFLQPIVVEEVGSVKGEDDTIDLYARIKNPNTMYRADISNAFRVNGAEVTNDPEVLFPGEERYIVKLGYHPQNPAAQTSIDPLSVRWKRLSSNDLALLQDRTRFEVSNITFKTSQPTIGVDRSQGASVLTFSLANKGGTSFWSVKTPIILKSGGQVVAVSERSTAALISNSSTILEARWFNTLPAVDTYVIQPIVDSLDPSMIKPPEKQTPSDVRSNTSFQ